MSHPSQYRFFPLAVAAACAFIAATAFAKIHSTKEFEDGSTRPVTVAVLPSHVELTKQRMIRSEAQVEESGDLEPFLTAAVAEEFRSRGYEVRVIDADAIAADPALQELVVDANRRFGELMANVGARFSKSSHIEDRRYNAGDTVKLLASRLGVDAVTFTRMQIIAPGAGVRALNFGMGGESAMMSVTVIDGESSDIEAFITLPVMRRGNAFGGHDEIVENPVEEMGKYARATLDDLPEADPEARVEESDAEVLADLESLLDE
jgi:hypothetical protein